MIKQVLEKIKEDLGVEYAEHHFDEGPELPYITYEGPETNNYYADGVVYFSSTVVDMLLHTGRRQFDLEKKIEQILKSFYLSWSKAAEWDDKEELFIVTYTMQEAEKEGDK